MIWLIITYSVITLGFFFSGFGSYVSKARDVENGTESSREYNGWEYVTKQVPIKDKPAAMRYLKTARLATYLSPIWPSFIVYVILRSFSKSRTVEKELAHKITYEAAQKAIKEHEERLFKDV